MRNSMKPLTSLNYGMCMCMAMQQGARKTLVVVSMHV